MNFGLKEAIAVANQVLLAKSGRNLTDVEILVLQGAWQRDEYDQIAAKHQYATSYISQDVAPKLWKALSDALGEKVKKSNFKEALKRQYEQLPSAEDSAEQNTPAPVDRSPVVIKPEQTAQADLDKQSDVQPDVQVDVQPDEWWQNYIERPPIESIGYETLLQPGALIRVKAPALMGKTLFTHRLLTQIAAQNYRTASLSFDLADREIHFTNLDRFLRWLCVNLSRELNLPNQLEEYWDEVGMGSKVSCTTYIEEYLLAADDRPLVLCLDDVDTIFPYVKIYEDVFALLRSWYEKARTRQNWRKLRQIIVHSTDVYIQLNIHQSPFNVGVPIELPEFTIEQVQALARQQGGTGDIDQIKPLMHLVGGHPYLLEQAFNYFKQYPTVSLAQFLAEAATDSGLYASHLREHWLTLKQNPDLAIALKTVMAATHPVRLEPMQAYQLQSMGLVKLTGSEAEPRCNLYQQYFQTHLIN